ncbi:MAG: hypothetical protein QM664_04555 [Flavihumibacter sp.]
MTTTINNMEALRQEQRRLEALIDTQKQVVRADMQRLRTALEPATKMLNVVGRFTGDGKGKTLLQTGLGLGLDVLMGRTFFRKAGPVARLAMPFLIRNVSSGVVVGAAGKLVKAVGSLFGRRKKELPSHGSPVHRH